MLFERISVPYSLVVIIYCCTLQCSFPTEKWWVNQWQEGEKSLPTNSHFLHLPARTRLLPSNVVPCDSPCQPEPFHSRLACAVSAMTRLRAFIMVLPHVKDARYKIARFIAFSVFYLLTYFLYTHKNISSSCRIGALETRFPGKNSPLVG